MLQSTCKRISICELVAPVTSYVVSFMIISQLGVILQSKMTKAGTCWNNINPVQGRCQGMVEAGVTKEYCCENSGVNHGWSDHEGPSDTQIFYWMTFHGGAPSCQPCHNTCDHIHCEEGKRCEMKNSRPKCVCAPDCTSIQYPAHASSDRHICSYEAKTFRNKCSLLKYNCRRKTQMTVDYYSRCQKSCDTVTCEEGSHCNTDQNGTPHCLVCPDTCPDPATTGEADQRVCGSDNQTYPSFCHLHRQSCSEGLNLMVAYNGQCRVAATCDNVQCDLYTQCFVDSASRQPHCVDCTLRCLTSVFGSTQVCGTDGTTYNSWCQLYTAGCRQRKVVRTLHGGRCGSDPHGPVDDVIIT